MNWIFFVIIFIGSCFILAWLSSRLVNSLVLIAKYLRWREFIIAFFVMAFAASLPNLFVDLNAVFQGIPELALGDIIGGNLVDLTLVLGIAVFFSKNGLSAKSQMVQQSALFTTAIAILPLLLVIDQRLDRTDGVLLIASFLAYSFWIFSKKERFNKVYSNSDPSSPVQGFTFFLVQVGKILVLLLLLLVASQAVVSSAQFFSQQLGISLALVGILIVGLGNCFPETYFSIISARKEQNWLVLGDLMGSVIISSTLVLGVVVLIAPFEVRDISPFFIARMFLIIAALVSLLFIRTGRSLSKKEGLVLLLIYVAFLVAELFMAQEW